jgi:UDP-3-O-[3-hydroxymyristoyl] glucosamine N-acyltransferase
MIGDYCNIEDGVVVQPGTLVGNYTHIRSLKVVSENTIDRSLIA